MAVSRAVMGKSPVSAECSAERVGGWRLAVDRGATANRQLSTIISSHMSIGHLFRTKSLDDLVAETQEEGHQLKKALGPWNLVALGIGAIIGAGRSEEHTSELQSL